MQDDKKLIDAVDALLPQTQCKLCQYEGCRPYAEAIVTQNQEINRCLPGGVKTLQQLGNLLQKEINPYLAAMEKNAKTPAVAVIREAECIGCTKCINACPVDAIIGAGKLMHTVLADICTGCELCIPPCPVDCIDMINIEEKNDPEKIIGQNQSRQRYENRQQRLLTEQQIRQQEYLNVKNPITANKDLEQRKKLIAEAVARVKKK